MVTHANSKCLRFAALIRVSTETQQKKGESLRTQQGQASVDIPSLGGKIAGWYGGQEHATPGHETREVDRLVADANKGLFDAVWVPHADRWSRDNAKSKAGLETFRKCGIRFFVGTVEYDLFDPTQRFYLGMSAEIGELHAATQNKKSTDNRISRAKRGVPTGGKLPFGRVFNRNSDKWEIVRDKQVMMEDVAKRFLAGESLADLADEYNVNHSNLHKTLTKRCGDDWQIKWDVPSLNIKEVVPLKIPRLLPQETIDAVLKKVAANKTYCRKQRKHKYLLSRLIFCEHCGYAMFGQMNHQGTPRQKPYYRHAHTKRCRECPCKVRRGKWADARVIEDNVIRRLFELFANPVRIRQAIEAATPDRQKIVDLRKRQKQLEAVLAKTRRNKSRILSLSADENLADDAEVKKCLLELRDQEANDKKRLQHILDQLDGVPSAESVHKAAEYASARMGALRASTNDYHDMTWEEKRALVEMVFGGKTPDGSRCGVYISWKLGPNRKARWKYSIRGAINETLRSPMKLRDLSEYYDDPERVEWERGVTPCASH